MLGEGGILAASWSEIILCASGRQKGTGASNMALQWGLDQRVNRTQARDGALFHRGYKV